MDNWKQDHAESQLPTHALYSCVATFLLGLVAGLLVVIPMHPIAVISGLAAVLIAMVCILAWLGSRVRIALAGAAKRAQVGLTRTAVILPYTDRHMN